MAEEAEELVEAEIVGEGTDADQANQGPVRPLPERTPSSELDAWRGEVKTVVVAAAGGLAAGAAAVAAVNAIRERSEKKKSSGRGRLGRKGKDDEGILASRSFLIDVHMLGR